MSELVEFIRGRLDADEQTARAAFASDRGEKLQPSRADIYGDGWATAALGSMGGDPVVVSGDQLDLDAIEAIATENPGGPMLVLPETLLSLVAEVRRLRAEVERMADTLADTATPPE